jgi:hypothetical protein
MRRTSWTTRPSIPKGIVDDDGLYARLRDRGHELAPRLEHLLGRLAGLL